ncbi:MAG: BON domain-containing protein [Rhodothermales bacterium]
MADTSPKNADGRPSRTEPPKVSDRVLAKRLGNLIERDLYLTGVEDVRFFVKDGVVLIRGSVRHYLDRSLLVSLVESIPGVRSVAADLKVAPFQADR